jgi:hypothetical protein
LLPNEIPSIAHKEMRKVHRASCQAETKTRLLLSLNLQQGVALLDAAVNATVVDVSRRLESGGELRGFNYSREYCMFVN